MHYALPTKILQGANTASGTVFKQRVLEFVVKILVNYTGKNFLKIPF